MQDLKVLCYQTESLVMLLTEKYNRLRVENEKLKEDIAELKSKIVELNRKIDMQAEDIVKYKLRNAVEKQSTTDVKLKINELVRDIDACLNMLNE